ncbi:hypothetical protein [Pelagicoccus sp. SDUM812002]|uniref:hypothetical protein n=1 Tax=Pelagicoccus sp. SDUM812002 TaxID=3041266 RepID=UPI00280D4EAC|nr:hypothetical protein [Pelagicoccus sp. SDUM812002]MDQ8185086.1 hypothetical protein [Pelagicoccus sp. SDUM812002]
MPKIAAILLLLSLTSLAQAGDTFKLLLSDKHAGAIIAYLDSVDIESVEAKPFAEFQPSEKLVAALARYASLMEETIYQQREQLIQGGSGAAANFADLLDAKIRYQIALNAIQEMKPEHFLATVTESEPLPKEKPILAEVSVQVD